jgi:glyoxylase-like metal-dependent hydrolase (beta-lactamase superfamily II)
MTAADPEIRFDLRPPGVPDKLVRLSPMVRRIVADNPGPMTFTGTCAYVIGNRNVAVIDPGPDSPAHLSALLEGLKDERVRHILVTHTHRDHSTGAAALKAATGAKIIGCTPVAMPGDGSIAALDAAHDRDYAPDAILYDGDEIEGPGYVLKAVATPGHTGNHLAFALPQERTLFSGDHVMAWATTVVIPPDGRMGDYMASLEKLLTRDDVQYWPGHGGGLSEPQRMVRALLHHRRLREAAILTALDKQAADIPALVAALYQGLDARLRGAAGLSILAHLRDLTERGLVLAPEGDGLAGLYSRA